MGKNKLARFSDMERFENVLQPALDDIINKDYELKGNWKKKFSTDLPITLELGCGKGEYTVALAEKFPDRNFMGIDIKGARMWRGALTAIDKKLHNVLFLRTRIEFITSFFGTNEINEIWITFPDPQLKDRRKKKRLTHPNFLTRYRSFLTPGGIIHLKTDNLKLYEYTLAVAQHNKFKVHIATNDLYNSNYAPETHGVYTHYEKMFLEKNIPIKYLRFSIDSELPIQEPTNVE